MTLKCEDQVDIRERKQVGIVISNKVKFSGVCFKKYVKLRRLRMMMGIFDAIRITVTNMPIIISNNIILNL